MRTVRGCIHPRLFLASRGTLPLLLCRMRLSRLRTNLSLCTEGHRAAHRLTRGHRLESIHLSQEVQCVSQGLLQLSSRLATRRVDLLNLLQDKSRQG